MSFLQDGLMRKPAKEKKLSYYKKRAWDSFSQFIRLRDSAGGYAKCCTCEIVEEWKYLQAGHFVAGRNNSILFREDNCHAQCVGCNFFGKNSRSFGKYYEFMKARYGVEVIDELLVISKKEVIFKKWDYQEIEAKYKEKFEILKSENT